MLEKQEALIKIVSLMKEHSISLADIKIVLNENNKNNSMLKKFFSFLGGLFILCGLIVYISQHWFEMNSLARIVITLVVGLSFFLLAIIAETDKRYERMMTPLYLLAAFFETVGMFVTINELFVDLDPYYVSLIVFGTLFLQQIITFSQFKRTSLLFTTLFFGTAFTLAFFDYWTIQFDWAHVIVGVILIGVAYRLSETQHRVIAPVWYFVGATLFLSASFNLLHYSPFELLYFGISILVIYFSTIVGSRVLLFCGAVSLVGYIGYFTEKYFVDSLGVSLGLIIFGIIFLCISAFTLRLSKKIKSKDN